uniref:Helix-turn-helix domain-containing protein n=1 Tax=Candidatus Nitrotoga fabula TaxID=2182327 RepID=A0A2X0SMX0_9PROT|nr:conserved protein of unknown function [Candidatus Nitrotoga fabula]
MSNFTHSRPKGHSSRAPKDPPGNSCIALTDSELAIRWGLSVKTLRRWRQESLGPIFCKLGSRVVYLVADVEAYERRVSRFSTSAPAYPAERDSLKSVRDRTNT